MRTGGIVLAGVLSVVFFVAAAQQVLAHKYAMARFARFGVLDRPRDTAAATPAVSGVPVLRAVGARLARLVPSERLQQMRIDLVRAGLGGRLSAEELLGLRVLCVLSLVALGLMLTAPLGPIALMIVVLGVPFGYLLPTLMLRWLSRGRREEIDRLLPGMVEVLAVSLEAGLGLLWPVLRRRARRADEA